MSEKYLRKVRATFPGGFIVNPGGLGTDQLKVEFAVSKDLASTQNDATIKIWNLAPAHRGAIGEELKDVILEVGYMSPSGASTLGIIATGQIRDVEHDVDQPDIITTITLGDGDRSFRKATTSKTFPSGTKVTDVIEQLSKDLEAQGLKRGEQSFPDALKERKYKRPVTIHGMSHREMDMLSRSHGFHWSSQNGTLEILPSDGTLAGVAIISPETGLESVTPTDNGMKCRTLMDPAIRPGRMVDVQSKMLRINGRPSLYRVSALTLEGDNKSGPFHCNVTGETVGADGKVDEGEV